MNSSNPAGIEATRGQGPNVGVIVIHGVGEAEPGWINKYIVDRLKERQTARGGQRLRFEDGSEVYDLPDEGSPDPEATFKTHVRRARFGEHGRAAFIELSWSDLSRVGQEPITQAFAALRLFYEAPNVLTRSFLPSPPNWFHALLRLLVLIAIGIVRWVVAGLNGALFIAVFAIAAIGLALKPLSEIAGSRLGWSIPPILEGDGLAYALLATLALLAVLTAWLAERGDKAGFGLTDVWFSTALFSALGLGILAVMQLAFREHRPATLADMLVPVIEANFWVGIAWDAVAVCAIVLWLLVCAVRAAGLRGQDAPPLTRISAALALAIIQAQVWKVCVPAAGVLTIDALDLSSSLADQQKRLMGVGVLNSFLTAILVVLAIVLVKLGGWMRRLYPGDIERAAGRVPRVIISWALVTVLVGGTLANLYLHYIVEAKGEIGTDAIALACGTEPLSDCIANSPWLRLAIIAAAATVLVLFATGRLQSLLLGVLHFGRDIVDHQYRIDTPLARRAARRRSTRLAAAGRATSGRVDGDSHWPRRSRIRQRLDTLMEVAVVPESYDRIVFLAHSQGTVIMHDCFCRGSAVCEPALAKAREVHALTLGSPISHLYSHYFAEYEASNNDTRWLKENVASWTNMWRIDDPIANGIVFGSGGRAAKVLRNIPLEPGGHDDYWSEEAVQDAILDLVIDGRIQVAPAAGEARPERAGLAQPLGAGFAQAGAAATPGT